MIHEPECVLAGRQYTVTCVMCGQLRAAYQRGRQNAAEDVSLAIHDAMQTGKVSVNSFFAAILAARGDGKQA